ncbi:hypothetical protein [Marinobacterium litorale]|uniref:hypothetical protein n=1 Tax=Marinobacterium litorale TaxID=404770 RepID=UPI0003FD840F|nr:hypothetical protein [Marinobacterium litorale]
MKVFIKLLVLPFVFIKLGINLTVIMFEAINYLLQFFVQTGDVLNESLKEVEKDLAKKTQEKGKESQEANNKK